jgi:probable O-glycosylation ligase (exosortase A-associated)
LLPGRLTDRIHSITEQETEETRDASATGRIQAWQTAWNIAVDNPLTGAGFRALWHEGIWLKYYRGEILAVRDAHSLYFELLEEHGFLGLGIYLLVLVSTLMSLRHIRKRWRGHPEHGVLANYAEMTQLGLYPFMVAGAFLTVAYFDLYFAFVATSAVLRRLSEEAEKAVAMEPAPLQQAGRTVPVAPLVVARARRRPLPARRNRHA